MKKCTTCGHEGEGKFCGKCGTKFPEAPAATAATKACPSCGRPAASAARFCGGCGHRFGEAAAPAPVSAAAPSAPIRIVPKANPSLLRGAKIIWSLEPQIVAQRLDEERIASLSGARGIIIREGTRALIFVDGRLVGEFTEGEYDFRDALTGGGRDGASSPQTVRVGGVLGSLRGMAGWVGRMLLGEKISADEARRRAAAQEAERAAGPAVADQPEYQNLVDTCLLAVKSQKAIAIVLARSDDFPLIFNYKALKTADLATDVAVDVLMRVTDLTDFYRDFLMDHRLLTTQKLAERLAPVVDLAVAEAVRTRKVEDLQQNRSLLEALEQSLNAEFQRTMPSVKVSRAVKVTARREEIERLQKLAEQLYLSERELTHLQAQNEFSNRLRLEENRQALLDARNDVELEQKLREVNRDKILGDEEFAKWIQRVKLDRELTTARTDQERAAALHEIEKSGVLRAEEMEILTAQSGLRSGHAIDLFQMRQELESRRLRLELDTELAPKERELELARRRQDLLAEAEFAALEDQAALARHEQELRRQDATDTYGDKRRTLDRGHRREDSLVEHEEQVRQLDLARKAQELAEARRQSDHQRELAQLQAASAAQRDTLVAEAQRWAGMSVEQIMAANPQLTPDAAKALAERASAAKAEEFAKKQADLAMASKDEIKEMARQQMEAQERLLRSLLDSNAAIAGAQLRGKDAELDRALGAADRSEERLGRAVASTAAAMGGRNQPAPAHRHCAKCGVLLTPDTTFCSGCGTKA